jgi:hypothetical protein|tara:strand:+ start:244 stop:438 length:195 start_codon:yes stop_codon:yes gene_type:complete
MLKWTKEQRKLIFLLRKRLKITEIQIKQMEDILNAYGAPRDGELDEEFELSKEYRENYKDWTTS